MYRHSDDQSSLCRFLGSKAKSSQSVVYLRFSSRRQSSGNSSCIMPTLVGSQARFVLRSISQPLPSEYRLATRHDIATFKGFLYEAMPAWEIAMLADGWVDGCLYGGNTGSDAREPLGHKLGVLAHTTHFVLHARTERFPPQYRLANRLDIDLFKPFLFEVVPTGEVAYLEDGWVDSGYLQCKIGPDKREVLLNQVGILVPSRVFYLQELDKPFPAHYRLATRQDVKLNTKSLWESMPAWEIAHLADGWADGKGYGGKTGQEQRVGVQYKLGFLDLKIPVVDEAGLDIVLDPTGELEHCLSTALTKAELSKLANFAPVSDAHDKQAVRELCAMWDMDHMLHGMSQMTLYSHEAYSIKLRCDGITGECSKHILDERGAPSSDEYYEVDVHANDRLSASILVPVGKPVGAAAIRKAFTESLENSAIAMFVPAPTRLKESYRWVLIVEPASAERAVIFYAVV